MKKLGINLDESQKVQLHVLAANTKEGPREVKTPDEGITQKKEAMEALVGWNKSTQIRIRRMKPWEKKTRTGAWIPGEGADPN